MSKVNIKCPVGHDRVWLKGKVPTRKGLKARYLCYECGRSFYAPDKPAPKKVSKSTGRKKS